ncbi:hypothetical protein R54767_03194 [Paraburkholderia gardini]|uniref:Uncharacterized protein n=1 Tax=Paraburkholderia gardini TaxID=2823469 RepID=A0ABN7QLB5_9BURK|nr:hypothetical protein R54767_03194 [Paraburkholderia gardini]
MAPREASPSSSRPRWSAHDLISRTAPPVTQGSFIPLRATRVAEWPLDGAGIRGRRSPIAIERAIAIADVSAFANVCTRASASADAGASANARRALCRSAMRVARSRVDDCFVTDMDRARDGIARGPMPCEVWGRHFVGCHSPAMTHQEKMSCRSAFLLPTFLWQAKEKYVPPRTGATLIDRHEYKERPKQTHSFGTKKRKCRPAKGAKKNLKPSER